MKKKYVGRNLIFEREKRKALENKLGCKFIRINTSKKVYDADHDASRIQTFINKFRDRKLQKLNKKIKEPEGKIKGLKLQLTSQSV